jgi:hypothetical protein
VQREREIKRAIVYVPPSERRKRAMMMPSRELFVFLAMPPERLVVLVSSKEGIFAKVLRLEALVTVLLLFQTLSTSLS